MKSEAIKLFDIYDRIKILKNEIKNLKEQPDTFWRYGEKEYEIKKRVSRIEKHNKNKLKALDALEKAIQKERELIIKNHEKNK